MRTPCILYVTYSYVDADKIPDGPLRNGSFNYEHDGIGHMSATLIEELKRLIVTMHRGKNQRISDLTILDWKNLMA